MSKHKKVTSNEEFNITTPGAILGTYDGECADSNITNLNGLDITREVWEAVFASDEYKKAIDLGHYIGFLGHPQDPDCQDFRKACIVMTEGHIDDNGKVYGKFNLINTPVGQIVKAFQDAGVIFGISVRGAGDIIQNSVDPETFVFRGFDLVTFPAFPESIPKFTAIAASTDSEQRQKYQAVCAAVKNNIDSLDTVESVEMIQSCFAKQSEEYQELENHKNKIQSNEAVTNIPEDAVPIMGETVELEECIDPRVDSMTKMYLELKEQYDALALSYRGLQEMYDNLVKDNDRRTNSIERIFTSQMNDLLETVDAKTNEVKNLRKILASKENRLSRIQGSISAKTQTIEDLNTTIDKLENRLSKVEASLQTSQGHNKELKMEVNKLKEVNLKYNRKVEAAQNALDNKESIICSLNAKLDETVRGHADEHKKTSNLDAQIRTLESKVTAAETLVEEYRDAYAHLYANALGVRLPALSVTASTDVSSLQDMIRCGTSVAIRPDIMEPTQDVEMSDFDLAEYADDDTELVTL